MRKISLSLFFICISFAYLIANDDPNNMGQIGLGDARISSTDFVSVSVSDGKVNFTFHEDIGNVECEVENTDTNETNYECFDTSNGEGSVDVSTSGTGYRYTVTAEDGSSINGIL